MNNPKWVKIWGGHPKIIVRNTKHIRDNELSKCWIIFFIMYSANYKFFVLCILICQNWADEF